MSISIHTWQTVIVLLIDPNKATFAQCGRLVCTYLQASPFHCVLLSREHNHQNHHKRINPFYPRNIYTAIAPHL